MYCSEWGDRYFLPKGCSYGRAPFVLPVMYKYNLYAKKLRQRIVLRIEPEIVDIHALKVTKPRQLVYCPAGVTLEIPCPVGTY